MRTPPAVEHQIGGLEQEERTDAVIAAIADAQHGLVSRAQLLNAGVSRRQVERRLEAKRLHPVLRGVYAVGHGVLSQEARWMAAVLAGGSDAVLSHWSAASLWRMRQGRGPRSHVTTRRARRSSARITFHQSELAADEVTVENNLPVTTPARTALDLAPSLTSAVLARMIDAAGPGTRMAVAELIDRYPNRAGVPKLRVVITRPQHVTRSDFEAEVLEQLENLGAPPPAVNATIEGYEVDLAWPEHRVIAEIDSYATHGSAEAFERDRERDRKLAIAGWRVVRVTDQSGVEDLSRLLAATAAREHGPSSKAA